MYFYSDKPSAGASHTDVWAMNGTTAWLTHYDNRLFLEFVNQSPLSSVAERDQARRELVICDRKLSWWSKHPKYDAAAAATGALRLKSRWAGR